MDPSKILKPTYSIESYHSEWVTKFNSIKELLTIIFNDYIVDIQHVGSTSIPGMKSKPIIDILITINSMQPFINEKIQMSKFGYQFDENILESNSLIFSKKENGINKSENIHVCEQNSRIAVQLIQTRDYLRTHPERASAYGDLKDKLKQTYPNNYSAYRAGKQDFLKETERLASNWSNKK